MNVRSPITPCIFGTAKGFDIETLTRVPLNVEDLDFAIKSNEVELGDREFCVKIFRKRVKSEIFTWIGLYSQAHESGNSRNGGYYGAGIWLEGITVNSADAVEVLIDLADQVEALAIRGGQFQKSLAVIVDLMQLPPKFLPLMESGKGIVQGGLAPDATHSVYLSQIEKRSIQQIIDWALNDRLAENFSTIIIGSASSFPRGASSRLERYASLDDAKRALEIDLAAKYARLEAENARVGAENARFMAENARLTAEMARLRAEIGALKVYNDKLKHANMASYDYDSEGWSWTDILKLSSVFVLIFGICVAAWYFLSPIIKQKYNELVPPPIESQSETQNDNRQINGTENNNQLAITAPKVPEQCVNAPLHKGMAPGACAKMSIDDQPASSEPQ